MSLKESCIILDLVMAAIFFLIGFLFYRSNGKAANFLTGYNMKSAEERKKYDEKKMCKDYGKHMMLWSIPFIIGAVLINCDIFDVYLENFHEKTKEIGKRGLSKAERKRKEEKN